MSEMHHRLGLPFGWQGIPTGHKKKLEEALGAMKDALKKVRIAEQNLYWIREDIAEYAGPNGYQPGSSTFQRKLITEIMKEMEPIRYDPNAEQPDEELQEWKEPPDDVVVKTFFSNLTAHLGIPITWHSLPTGYKRRFQVAHGQIKTAIMSTSEAEKALSQIADEVIDTLGTITINPKCANIQELVCNKLLSTEEESTLPVNWEDSSDGETIKLNELLPEIKQEDTGVGKVETSLGHGANATQNESKERVCVVKVSLPANEEVNRVSARPQFSNGSKKKEIDADKDWWKEPNVLRGKG